jgi:hypothetical protein
VVSFVPFRGKYFRGCISIAPLDGRLAQKGRKGKAFSIEN